MERAGGVRGRRVAVGAAALVLLGAGGLWWGATASDDTGEGGAAEGPGSSASCAAVVEFGGLTYEYAADVVAVPQGLTEVGTGRVPGCADGGTASAVPIPVEAMPGVAVTDAVVVDGTVFVLAGATVPDLVRPLLDPPPCTGGGEHRLVGELKELTDPAADTGEGLDPPYGLRLAVDAGDVPGGYAVATVDVRVTAATEGVDDGTEIVREAFVDGTRVAVLARCDGERYEALTLGRAGSA